MNTIRPWQAALLRSGASLLTGGRHRALLVMIYHRVLPEPDPLLPSEPDVQKFAAQMSLVSRLFHVVDLVEGVRQLREGSLPPRAVAITFDDGYANNLEIAAPVLKDKHMKATVFVSAGFMDGSLMWNDLVIESLRRATATLDLRDLGLGLHHLHDIAARRRAIDELLGKIKYLDIEDRFSRAREIARRSGTGEKHGLMMDEQQLRGLSGMGITVGAHCVSHPILCRTSDGEAREEIRRSKQVLEEVTGAPVRAFAYPNGRPFTDYDSRHVEMVRDAGFEVAVTTAWGAATRATDPLQVPRIAPWDSDALAYGARMVKALLERQASSV